MSADIIIAYAYLDYLADQCSRAAELLGADGGVSRRVFAGNPQVTAAYDEFVERWESHRSELTDAVRTISTAFEMVSASFNQVEDHLCAQLDGGEHP